MLIRHSIPVSALLLAGSLAAAQTAPAPAAARVKPAPARTTTPSASKPDIITVPAGTRVLLQLKSSINTKSARPGDGVYLTSIFPVVADNRVVIPPGVYVQGVVDSVVHPGRGFGHRAKLNMHFTSMIFPNGSVVDIPGVVNSLPGAKNQSVRNREGTIEQTGGGHRGRNAAQTARIAVPTGATVGSIGGLGSGHPMAGGLEGAAAGLAAAGVVALFTRRAQVNIPAGTQIEMVLQRPLELTPANLRSGSPAEMVPVPNQPQPLPKPALHRRHRILCPAGSLGCS
jgi:type IV secretion system protein VirB10